MLGFGILRCLGLVGPAQQRRPTHTHDVLLQGGNLAVAIFAFLLCSFIGPTNGYTLFESDILPEQIRVHLPTDTAVYLTESSLFRVNLITNQTDLLFKKNSTNTISLIAEEITPDGILWLVMLQGAELVPNLASINITKPGVASINYHGQFVSIPPVEPNLPSLSDSVVFYGEIACCFAYYNANELLPSCVAHNLNRPVPLTNTVITELNDSISNIKLGIADGFFTFVYMNKTAGPSARYLGAVEINLLAPQTPLLFTETNQYSNTSSSYIIIPWPFTNGFYWAVHEPGEPGRIPGSAHFWKYERGIGVASFVHKWDNTLIFSLAHQDIPHFGSGNSIFGLGVSLVDSSWNIIRYDFITPMLNYSLITPSLPGVMWLRGEITPSGFFLFLYPLAGRTGLIYVGWMSLDGGFSLGTRIENRADCDVPSLIAGGKIYFPTVNGTAGVLRRISPESGIFEDVATFASYASNFTISSCGLVTADNNKIYSITPSSEGWIFSSNFALRSTLKTDMSDAQFQPRLSFSVFRSRARLNFLEASPRGLNNVANIVRWGVDLKILHSVVPWNGAVGQSSSIVISATEFFVCVQSDAAVPGALWYMDTLTMQDFTPVTTTGGAPVTCKQGLSGAKIGNQACYFGSYGTESVRYLMCFPTGRPDQAYAALSFAAFNGAALPTIGANFLQISCVPDLCHLFDTGSTSGYIFQVYRHPVSNAIIADSSVPISGVYGCFDPESWKGFVWCRGIETGSVILVRASLPNSIALIRCDLSLVVRGFTFLDSLIVLCAGAGSLNREFSLHTNYDPNANALNGTALLQCRGRPNCGESALLGTIAGTHIVFLHQETNVSDSFVKVIDLSRNLTTLSIPRDFPTICPSAAINAVAGGPRDQFSFIEAPGVLIMFNTTFSRRLNVTQFGLPLPTACTASKIEPLELGRLRLTFSLPMGDMQDQLNLEVIDDICFDDSNCPGGGRCQDGLCVAGISTATCDGLPPFQGAECLFGAWIVRPSGELTPQNSSQAVNSTTVIVGDFVQPVTLKFAPGGTISVTGCVVFEGSNISITLPSGQHSGEAVLFTFENGFCRDTPSPFSNISATIDGLTECEALSISAQYERRSMAIAFQIVDAPCASPGAGSPAALASAGGFQIWMLGPIVGSLFALILIIAAVLVIFRRRIVPSLRFEEGLKIKQNTL